MQLARMMGTFGMLFGIDDVAEYSLQVQRPRGTRCNPHIVLCVVGLSMSNFCVSSVCRWKVHLARHGQVADRAGTLSFVILATSTHSHSSLHLNHFCKQGIGGESVIIVRKKYFVTDSFIDVHRPAALHMLYLEVCRMSQCSPYADQRTSHVVTVTIL